MKAEAGSYWAKLTGVDVGLGGKKKTPRIRLILMVFDKAGDGEWEPFEDPFERSVDFWTTDAALEWTLLKLAGLGFDGNFGDPSIQSFDPELSTEGCQLECEVRQKQNGSGTFEEWSFFKLKDLNANTLEPLGGKEIDRLSSRYKQSQANMRKPDTAPGAPSAADAPSQGAGTPEQPPGERSGDGE